jgi:predicted transcriptional regulator
MAVLLLFNNRNSYSVKELAKHVETDVTLMQQVVSTLIRNNLLLRTQSLSIQNIEPDDTREDELPDPDESGLKIF